MFHDTPLVRVNDAEALAEAVEALSHASVIGVDTESDSFYSYQEKVCLIQLSDLERDYVIDPLSIDDLSSLAPIMANPDVVKILHGADYDVVCLKRDYDFQITNIFDTLIAAQLLGLERIGLADLIKRYFGHEIEKKYQRHDWSRRPLLPEHIEYARGDTHFLLALRELMTRKLNRDGRMRHMVEECTLIEDREWQGRRFDPDGYFGIKNVRVLDQKGLRVLRRLWLFRDETARKLDRPVFKVMPDAVLLDVAKSRPESERELERLLPGKSAMKRRYGKGLLRAVDEGLDDTETIEVPRKERKKPKRSGRKPRLRGRHAERALADLKEWRNRLVANSRNTPFTVASNGVLQAIAAARPHNLDELSMVPQVRDWQVQDFGVQILEILDAVDPRPED